MDPVTAAGLAISVTSLAFELFAGCVKGFVLLSTASNLGKDSSTILCMLNLQEIQLMEWAKCAGLLAEDGVLDRRLNETVVHATLTELRDLLSDTDNLKSRYKLGLASKPFAPQDEKFDSVPPMANGVLGRAISDDLRRDIMYRARLIQSRNSFPQRLWWAAVDKTRFEELIERVRSFIRELWYLLDPIRQEDMSQTLQVILAQVIGMTGRIDELSSLREAIQDSSKSGQSILNKRSESLASAVEIKTLNINIGAKSYSESATFIRSEDPSLGQGSWARPLKCDTGLIDHYTPMKNNSDMGIATYQGKPVFLEWKTLPRQFRSKIVERAEDLAFLLCAPKHPDFRSLQCTGLARDNDSGRLAFIFAMTASHSSQLPRCLRNLFSLSPSVTERLQLALKITQSVKCFHTAGWLHKNLRSENILFWVTDSLSSISEPVLAGFTFSRQDSPSQISEQPSSNPQHDIYRHPEAMGEPSVSFSAAKDIYALGTILLEIGEWRPLKMLVERVVDVTKKDVSFDQLAKVRSFVLDEGSKGGLGMLKFRMGDAYARVTKMMLSGVIIENPQVWKGEGDVFRPDLLDIAISELERCVI